MSTRLETRFQERCARYMLWLALLNTVPVIWLTPVSAGTAPTVALLGVGLANLFSLDREGVAFGLMGLVPGVIYMALGWLAAWALGRLAVRLGRPSRAALLACITVALLIVVRFPIYESGGHSYSRGYDWFALFGEPLGESVVLRYWVALQAVLASLFAGALLRVDHPFIAYAVRWAKPAWVTAGVAAFAVTAYTHHTFFVCRPFAELGMSRAQVCVAKNSRRDQRYWYERAAGHGNGEAIAWLVDNSSNREVRLKWLRLGAERGDAASQFALYQVLTRMQAPEANAEAQRWLALAAEGHDANAQMQLVEKLSSEVTRSKSIEQLAERNAWLERAAKGESRKAKLRLAQHYSDGGMGYPVDFDRARGLYRELLATGEPEKYEIVFGLDGASYEARLRELDAWEAGLGRKDPEVMKEVAKRLLASPLPGPGVRERGTRLMEELASAGDKDVRDSLIVALRTGSGGVDKDLDAAGRLLMDAAEEGDPAAMERVAGNYMNGREGFPIDYPKARHWIEAQLGLDRDDADKDAQRRVHRLKQELKYIDRLGGIAGGAMLGPDALAELQQRGDAQSQLEHALQLLAGHGIERRADAIAGLERAADLGSGEAAWRLFQIYDRGFPQEIDKRAALEQLKLAVANHHFNATRELAHNYENGTRGLPVDLSKAIALYEDALAAGHDNRHGWDLDPDNYNHFKWLESRLRQARLKRAAQSKGGVAGR